MPTFTQHDLHKHMKVYSSEKSELGHVTDVYEDSFVLQKGILPHHRYIPYALVSSIEGDQVQLSLSADEAEQPVWQKRPDYEHHESDPVQLMYDRGHGVHDPFDEVDPNK